MRLRNIWLALLDQGPPRRFLRNLFQGRLRGVLQRRSHVTMHGKPKVEFGHKETAENAAREMETKTGKKFSSYKCLYCDGYHIGKNGKRNSR